LVDGFFASAIGGDLGTKRGRFFCGILHPRRTVAWAGVEGRRNQGGHVFKAEVAMTGRGGRIQASGVSTGKIALGNTESVHFLSVFYLSRFRSRPSWTPWVGDRWMLERVGGG